MDKIAIISDVHGNITALNAVLTDIKNRQISKIISLGDNITKCTHPDLVIDTLKKECDIILLGNCDYEICKPESKNKNFWTRNKIGEDNANYILTLPKSYEFYLSGHLIRLFHASPHSLTQIFNPMYSHGDNNSIEITPDKLFENSSFISKTDDDPIPNIVGYGHIHTPFVVRYKNRTLFNPGSVGVPIEMLNTDINDKTNIFSTVASYIILEGNLDEKILSTISFQLIRVPYDIEKEIKDLQSSDMPNKQETIRSLISAISNR